MPQTALSNGELLKKTLKVVGVMVGSTAVWLGGISLIAILATGSSASATSSSPLDKAAPVASAAVGAGHPASGATPGGIKSLRRPALGNAVVGGAATKDLAKPGDPI
jgi:hypothetical protein